MKKILLFDFSRVLLHPKDKTYTGSLNDLYRSLLQKEHYDFFAYFSLNTELLTFLKKAKQTYPIYILTTDMIQNAKEIRKTLHEIFTEIFSAKDLGVSKTDPELYKTISERLKINPHEIIFIDDTMENISAAKKAGLQTIHYQTNTQLFDILKTI